MTQDAHRIPRPGVIALIRGITEDAKQLVLDHYELRRYQALQRLAEAKTIAIWIGIGILFAVVGGLLVILMVVHLLPVLWNIPLWGSYGIVGTALLLAAGICLYASKKRA